MGFCFEEECKIRACFGEAGGKAQYCKTHKRPTDVDVKHKTCQHVGCTTRPTYGMQGSKIALYCIAHKRSTDVNVKSKTCQHDGCTTQPTYGILGSKLALYCVDHKRLTDVDVKHKTCQHDGCTIQPTYGIQGSKLALYCVAHKRPTDVDVKNKTCQHDGCTKKPNYGLQGSKLALYCVTHKRPTDVNVRDKTCQHDGCTFRASWGLLFQDKLHCAKHKQKNEYLQNQPLCLHKLCREQPCYTDTNTNYPLRCETHKIPTDQNVIERPCFLCQQLYYLREDNLCAGCFEYSIKSVHKAKEVDIKLFLEANSIAYVSWDKRPENSCFKYRPDFILDYHTHIIIIEVDEHQHQSYNCQCEQVRMINLFQDFGGLPVTFLRYNPDTYTDHEGKKKKYQKSRTKRLLQIIKSLELHPPTKGLSAIYLYYDGDNGNNIIQKINYEEQEMETITEKIRNLDILT